MRQILCISHSTFGKQNALTICQTKKGHVQVPIFSSPQRTLVAVLCLLQAEKHTVGAREAIGSISRKPKSHIQLEVPPFRVREKNPAAPISKSSPITLKLLRLECPLIWPETWGEVIWIVGKRYCVDKRQVFLLD